MPATLILTSRLWTAALLFAALGWPAVSSAQPIGTFRWRAEPFCNVFNLTVTQNGSVFLLNGFDESCSGNPRLPVQGVAVLQNNGSLTLGLTVLSIPGGTPVNVEAEISLATVGGTWRDGAGRSGPFSFNPSGTSGSPRPLTLLAQAFRPAEQRLGIHKLPGRHDGRPEGLRYLRFLSNLRP